MFINRRARSVRPFNTSLKRSQDKKTFDTKRNKCVRRKFNFVQTFVGTRKITDNSLFSLSAKPNEQKKQILQQSFRKDFLPLRTYIMYICKLESRCAKIMKDFD